MKKRVKLLMVSAAIIMVASCASLDDVRYSRGEGSTHVFQRSYHEVWDVVPAAIAEMEPVIVESNKDEGFVLLERTHTTLPHGEKIAIFVDKLDGGRVRVEVVAKRTITMNALATQWEHRILDRIKLKLQNRSADSPTPTAVPE